MAKYYVQSGNFRSIITADDAEKAAIWVVHRTMEQILPIYSENAASSIESEAYPDAHANGEPAELKCLGGSIRVSELGFDTDDLDESAKDFDSFELVCQWNQLMVALDRLAALI
jgi:hypothetical protein